MAAEEDEFDECPICFEAQAEPLLRVCDCSFALCFWCWHRIKTEGTDSCPSCRMRYRSDVAPNAGFVTKTHKGATKKNLSKKLQSNSGQKGSIIPQNTRNVLPRRSLSTLSIRMGELEALFAPCSRLQQRLQREYYCTVVLQGGAADAKWRLREIMLSGNNASPEEMNAAMQAMQVKDADADRRGSGGGATNDNSGNTSEDWVVARGSNYKKKNDQLNSSSKGEDEAVYATVIQVCATPHVFSFSCSSPACPRLIELE